ncbi:sensor histidine kinase [Panacibacter sp. DH6]|uniref:Sensor histidine kinase n=1 Tax=Panacibacter microcysteis TaxID=2793269 RepID=A0A931E3U1_9BACT|nr:sensor histidine kinase [Panacibacter microcysteis]MBG9374780.1 sensor histidine kinase [Panacibacter microcysteis]
MFNRLLPLLFLLLIYFTTTAQTKKIDSLKSIADKTTEPEAKLAAILAYCEDYSNLNQDSLDKYAYVALELAGRSKNDSYKSLAQLTLAQDYIQWGWTDSALYVIGKELPKNPVTDDNRRSIYFRLKRLNAVAFGADGKIQDCLAVLYPLFTEVEKYKDTMHIIGVANSIGNVLMGLNQLDESKKWNEQSLRFCAGNFEKYKGSPLISRAQLLHKENKHDSVLYYLNTGINCCKKIEVYDRLAGAYRFMSVVYTGAGELEKAEDALKQMQECRRKAHNTPDAIIDDNIQIADFYANTGQLKKAIAFCWSKLERGDYKEKPKDSAKTFNTEPSSRLPFYLALARYLKEDKNFTEYQAVLEEIIDLKDSVYERNKAAAIAEIQTKYDVEQKENIIAAQQFKIAQRNYLLYGSLVFIVMASVITFLMWRNQRNKQLLKMRLAIEEEKRQASQSILDAEEKERKRIAADLHDNIGAYASAISADVESIAHKGFNGNEEQLHNLQQHSREIIHSLRDTIWVLNKDNITITGISDRVKNYVNKLRPSYESINIVVEEAIQEDIRIGSQKALNIFRIVQEAVHNTLKHSNAKNVMIKIESDRVMNISVADDGKGLPAEYTSDGNGLRNMQARAADAGIRLNVTSAAGNGTRISISDTTN